MGCHRKGSGREREWKGGDGGGRGGTGVRCDEAAARKVLRLGKEEDLDAEQGRRAEGGGRAQAVAGGNNQKMKQICHHRGGQASHSKSQKNIDWGYNGSSIIEILQFNFLFFNIQHYLNFKKNNGPRPGIVWSSGEVSEPTPKITSAPTPLEATGWLWGPTGSTRRVRKGEQTPATAAGGGWRGSGCQWVQGRDVCI